MALSTYTELQASIADEIAWDSDAVSADIIRNAIDRAESKINRKCRLREVEQLSDIDYPSNGDRPRFVPLPERFVEMLDLRIKPQSASDTDYTAVIYVPPQSIHKYYNSSSDSYFFTVRDQIEISKEAQNPQKLMMHYYKKWDIATDQTNWLLSNYSDVYFYGALFEIELYMNNDARYPLWKQLFNEVLKEINEVDERSRDDAVLDVSEIAGLSRHSYNILQG